MTPRIPPIQPWSKLRLREDVTDADEIMVVSNGRGHRVYLDKLRAFLGLPNSGTFNYHWGENPPADVRRPWWDTTDQTWNVYDIEAGVWIVTGGSAHGVDGVDGVDGINGVNGVVLPPARRIIGTLNHTVVSADLNAFVEFSAIGAKILTIPDDAFLVTNPMDRLTLRNAAVGSITMVPGSLGVTLTYAGTANVLVTHTTAQLMRVAPNTWYIL